MCLLLLSLGARALRVPFFNRRFATKSAPLGAPQAPTEGPRSETAGAFRLDSNVPEELRKLFEQLGGSGSVVVQGMDGIELFENEEEEDGGAASAAAADASAASLEALQNFDLKPKEVVEYLDRFVIQQSAAKKVLAVAVCDHYNHCRRFLDTAESQRPVEYAKPNVLLAGPTGVGKTYLMKTIARLSMRGANRIDMGILGSLPSRASLPRASPAAQAAWDPLR